MSVGMIVTWEPVEASFRARGPGGKGRGPARSATRVPPEGHRTVAAPPTSPAHGEADLNPSLFVANRGMPFRSSPAADRAGTFSGPPAQAARRTVRAPERRPPQDRCGARRRVSGPRVPESATARLAARIFPTVFQLRAVPRTPSPASINAVVSFDRPIPSGYTMYR